MRKVFGLYLNNILLPFSLSFSGLIVSACAYIIKCFFIAILIIYSENICYSDRILRAIRIAPLFVFNLRCSNFGDFGLYHRSIFFYN